jgi:hypothetical protein
MEGAFNDSMLQDPNWPKLDALLKSLPQSSNVIQFIEQFEAQTGYKIVKGGTNGGTGGNYQDHQITVDASLLPVDSTGKIGTATTAQLKQLVDVLTHELAHFVDPGETTELKQWGLSTTPELAVDNEMSNEAIAYVDEYVGDKQIGIPMTIVKNTQDVLLQSVLDGFASRDGGYTTAQFRTDALQAAKLWVPFANPSIAPKLTYLEFARFEWAVTWAGQGTNPIDWTKVVPGQITIQEDFPQKGQVTITTTAPLPTKNSTNTVTISGAFDSIIGNPIKIQSETDSGSTPIGLTTTVRQPDGSELVTVTGQSDAGGYNSTVQLNSVPANGATPAVSFTGDGNTLSNAQVNNWFNLSLLGSNNSLALEYQGQLAVQGKNNTVTFRRDTVPHSAAALVQFVGTIGGADNTINVTGNPNPTVDLLTPIYEIYLTGFNETVNASNGAMLTEAGLEASGTINGSNNQVFENGADLLTINGNNNILDIAPASTGVEGAAAAGSANITGTGETVTGSGSILTLGTATAVSLTGTNDSVTLGTSDTLTFGANSSASITGNGGIINASAAGGSITVSGSGNTVTKGSGGSTSIVGSNNQLTLSASGSSASVSGSGETVNATDSALTFAANSTGTVTGDANSLSLGTSAALTVSGTGVIVSGSNDFLTLADGASATATGVGNSVTLGTDAALTVSGTGDNVTLGGPGSVTLVANSSATVTGNSSTILATGVSDTITVNGSSNTIIKAAGGATTVNGSNDGLTLSATGSTAMLTGTAETVSSASSTLTLGVNSTATVTGDSNTISLGTGDALSANGTGETISAGADVITLGDSGTATVSGDGNTVNTGTGGSATVKGSSNNVTLAASSSVQLGANTTHNKVTGAGNTIGFGSTAQGIVAGTSNTANLGASDRIYINGNADTVDVQSGDVVYLASNIAVTLVGSGATIVGNSGDGINVTGTNDTIYADLSHIEINGANTGDIVNGNGVSGNNTNWGGYVHQAGAYGGYARGGYYAAGGAAAHAIASQHRVRLADIAEIGAADHVAARVGVPHVMADQLVQAMATWPPSTAPAMFSLQHDTSDPTVAHGLIAPEKVAHGFANQRTLRV